MIEQLKLNTVSPLLIDNLRILMSEELFQPFRLVGGTSLSLRFGHRVSDDIDLFTDADYGTIDFKQIEEWLQGHFNYFDNPSRSDSVGFGKMYYIGTNPGKATKLDLMYTDPFFSPSEIIDGIRFASTEQIVAMKMQAIATGGRKKDWWDIHMLLDQYPLKQMLSLHERWQPWTHDQEQLLSRLTDFSSADNEPDPRCLQGKIWDLIKLDIIDAVEAY